MGPTINALSQLPVLDDVKSILRQESERISYGFEHCSSFSASSASDLAATSTRMGGD